jgi:tripartite-type tricarboxylate transporter receptor subunit TctC
MTFQRRQFIAALGALGSAQALPAFAQQDFPNRPIKLLVPFSAGGSPDLLGRLIGAQAGKQMGQGIVVDNRLGANGIVAAEAVARAVPDGYTLLVTTGSHAINPSIYKSLPYDTLADFAPISLFTVAPALTLVVAPDAPLKTFKDFLEAARKKESNISFGSPGVGNTLHLAGELLNATAGTHMLHVPYKGAAPALTAVMGKEVTACFLSTTAAVLAVKAGQVRPLAVTSAKRITAFPDVPTMAESGVPGMDYNGGWIGLFAPAKTPQLVIQKLSAEINRAMQVPEVREKMLGWDSPPTLYTPEAFGKFFRQEMEKFATIVKVANVPMQ